MGWTAIIAAGLVAVSGLSAREVHGPGFELVVIDSLDKPDGPFWFVPHDNEAAAWRVGLEALQAHGGRLVAVENAGRRMWPAPCPVSCDPNRSLGANPYGDAVIRLMSPGQPVVGLHTNAPGRRGLGAGAGTTWADARDRNVWMPRALAGFADGDALAIVAGTRPKSDAAPPCLPNFMMGGAPMLYEEVRDGGDGSMSNDLALRQPERTYVALEARHGDDDSLRALLAILMACPAYAQP